MSGFSTIIKMNIKLLLRNKGYLCFLILLPILAVIILNVQDINMEESKENAYAIQELYKEDKLILNVSNDKLNVKVYDSSQSELSEYILKELAKTGSYRIHRYKSQAMSTEEVREKALYSANHNLIGGIIYIPSSFEEEILTGQESSMMVFEGMEDGRNTLLKNDLNTYLQSLCRYAALTGYQKEDLYSLVNTSEKGEPVKESVNIEVGETLNLSAKQLGSSSSIGYSLAFLTIAFLFSGVFIAANVIEERQNRVYNRFLLSRASVGSYSLAKLLMIILTVLMQTGIMGIAIKLLVKTDFGIPFASYLFLVFCLGLIFNAFSVVIGILANNVMTANYIAFIVWCMSAILAGLYFPLDGASDWWAKVSMLMPQRWVVKAAEMLMVEKSGVYSMFLLVVFSYLIVILCVGYLGTKMKRKE